jgi:hypothetical protein
MKDMHCRPLKIKNRIEIKSGLNVRSFPEIKQASTPSASLQTNKTNKEPEN